MKKNRFYFWEFSKNICWFLWLQFGLSTPVVAMDLMQAFEAALLHDARFRGAGATRDAGREEVTIGRALLLPKVSASYQDGRTRARTRAQEVISGFGSESNNSNTTSATVIDSRTEQSLLGSSVVSNRSTYRSQIDSQSSVGSINNNLEVSERESAKGSSSSGSVQLRQPLVDFGAMAGYRRGLASAMASEAEYSAMEQELMLRVAEAYANVLYADEGVNLSQSQLETLKLQHANNELLLAAGQSTIMDVMETQAKLKLAQALLIESEDAREVARSQLELVTGLSVGSVAPMNTQLASATQTPDIVDHWLTTALDKNMQLQSAAHQLSAAREAVQQAESGHFPKLELVATYSDDRSGSRIYNNAVNQSTTHRNTQFGSSSVSDEATSTNGGSASSTVGSDSRTGTSTSTVASSSDLSSTGMRRNRSRNIFLGIQLNIPIFDGGAISARSRQAAANFARVQAEFDGLRDRILTDLKQQFRLVQSQSRRVRALEEAVEAGKVSVGAANKGVAVGVRTNLDVLNARERLAQTQRDLAASRYGYLLSFLKLRLLAGVLSRQDLQAVADLEKQSLSTTALPSTVEEQEFAER